MPMPNYAAWAPRVHSLLRIMTALLFIEHGTSKFFGFPMAMKAPALFSLYWFAGAIELVFGVLLLIGLFSRCAAFVLSGHLAFAYFIGHAPKGFFPLTNGGESAVLFCFVFLTTSPSTFSVSILSTAAHETGSRTITRKNSLRSASMMTRIGRSGVTLYACVPPTPRP